MIMPSFQRSSPILTYRLEKMNQIKEQEFNEKFEKEQLKRMVKDLDQEKLQIMKKEK